VPWPDSNCGGINFKCVKSPIQFEFSDESSAHRQKTRQCTVLEAISLQV
jgi:hypothetical protein